MLELLAIAEPASDIERRGVVTADQAILRQGHAALKAAENPEESAKL